MFVAAAADPVDHNQDDAQNSAESDADIERGIVVELWLDSKLIVEGRQSVIVGWHC